MLKYRGSLVVGSVLAVLAVAPIQAAGVIAYGDPTDLGNQLWSGALAEDFTVNSTISVSALGVYNSGATGSIPGTLTVAIFSSSGSQVTPTLTFSGTCVLTGGDCFMNLASAVNLGPGNYSITTSGWGGSVLDGNANCVTGCPGTPGAPYTPPTLNTDGGLISFTGIGFSATPGLAYLAPVSPYPANEFNAGSFQFSSAVPEPSSVVGVSLGLLFCLIPRLRRQAR